MKKKNGPGGLFWFLVFMAVSSIAAGNVVGLIVFGGLAYWRYVAMKKKQAQIDLVNESQKQADQPPKLPDLPAKQAKPAPKKPKFEGPKLEDIPTYTIELSKEKRNRQQGFPEYTHSGITRNGHFDHFVAIDTETTGVTPYKDRIIELSAVKFMDCQPVEKFQTLINPKKKIPAEASAVNHITDEMVADAPTIAQVLPAFEDFISGQTIVGHNLQFDLKMLFYSGSTIMETKHRYIDTLQQSRKVLKAPSRKYEGSSWETDWDSDYDVENFKLGTLLEYYGIENEDAHRSTSDALATGQLFVELCNQIQNKYEM